MPNLLTIPQVAERLAVSARHVRRIIAAGDLPVVAVGEGRRGDRIDPRDLDRYIQRKKTNLRLEGERWGSASVKIRDIGKYRSERVQTALDDLLQPRSKPSNI